MNKPNPVTILHIIKGLGRGGAERLLVSTIRRHSDLYKFHIIYFLDLKDHLVEDLIEAGATVHRVRANSPMQMIMKIQYLIRLIRKISPNQIHAHLPISGFVSALASKATGISLIYTEHNLPSRYHFITRFLHSFTLRQADKLLAVSKTVEQDMVRHYPINKPVSILENGIDLQYFSQELFDQLSIRQDLNLPDSYLIIGTVAVFTQQKRLDRWIEICKTFYARHPQTFFILSGHGPLMPELKLAASDLIQKDAILFTDRTNTPETWIAAMDIYLMTSDYEGMPVAMLEAMGMAKPIVATSVGGIPTVIEHEVNGLLYSPDDLESAVLYLERLQANFELRKRLGQNARDLAVGRFSVQRMVGQLEEVYSEISTPVQLQNA